MQAYLILPILIVFSTFAETAQLGDARMTTSFNSLVESGTREPTFDAILSRDTGHQWRLGLDGGAFSLNRYINGKLMGQPLVIDSVTGQVILSGSNLLLNDIGRSSQIDNAATMTINSTEGVGYPRYVTNFGLLVNRHQTSTGKGDRIAASFIQVCDAMQRGESCVGDAPLAMAGGAGGGNYTGSNPRVLIPAGMANVGNAVGQEISTETHSPVGLKYGLLVGDVNQSGPDNSTTHGKALDTAIAISVNPSPPVAGTNYVGYRCDSCGFRNGITFGAASAGYPETFPILQGGTLLQAANSTTKLDFGFDLTGMAAGFNYGAIALPIDNDRNGIVWGYNHVGGIISSTAKSSGPQMTFTDKGLFIEDSTGEKMLLGLTNDGRFQTTLYTPATSKTACTKGQVSDDESYHYVCVATDKWRRVALSDF